MNRIFWSHNATEAQKEVVRDSWPSLYSCRCAAVNSLHGTLCSMIGSILMIAFLLLFATASYLGFSLFSSWYPDHHIAFYGAIAILAGLFLTVAWLFFVFFRSRADEKIPLERPLQKAAYYSMGVISFLFTFTVLRDLAALPLRFFRLETPLYSPGTTAAIVLFSLAGLFVGMMNARFRISTPLVPIPVENLPDSLEGLRIVQLSDVHFGSGPDLPQVKRLIDRALALKPDLVVLTGDIIDGDVSALDAEMAELKRFTPPLGTWFVLGNHECYWDHERSIRAMRDAGIRVLLNEGVEIDHAGESVFIAGVTDPAMTHFGGMGPEVPPVPESASFRLLLAHQPSIAPKVAEHPYHLQLSGHTHGGQFFPWNLLVRRVHRHHGGLNRLSKLWVYVSHGTGYWGPPVRLGTVGEITTLEIRRAVSS
ncbi:MAG: metallophosphoesterase [Proteobacteria bacterium]|nr:metallophosphoesterase [Pseudomonadota bacterium]